MTVLTSFSLADSRYAYAEPDSTITWTTRASMPTARWTPGVMTGNNGKLYAIGGWNGRAFATVEEYDPATDSWRARTSMLTSRTDHAVAAASNGKIYAFSGDNGSPNAFNTTEETVHYCQGSTAGARSAGFWFVVTASAVEPASQRH